MSQILFILTGSIACYKACEAISDLVQRGYRVRAVATKAALQFVGAATLEGLTRESVATDLFAAGAALDHIDLGRDADVVVVCPATAHTLNRMAAGLADDLAGAVLLAHDWKKPLVIAPAMNPAMWQHPATVASVARLREWGARFVPVGAGRTACGEIGEGRLAEPAEIVAAIEASLVRPARRLRVLITSGGTAEPIDGVRMITNASTGATGALVADRFARAGHEAVLLRAEGATRARTATVREEAFLTFAELEGALSRLLKDEHFDAVIHAAAVSDFSVEAIEVDGMTVMPGRVKLDSDAAPVLRLKRNPKLLARLREWSRNRALRVVAFKLTSGAEPSAVHEAVTALLEGGADFVVHNDLASRVSAEAFPAEIWRCGGKREPCPDRRQLAVALERLLAAPDAQAEVARVMSLPPAALERVPKR